MSSKNKMVDLEDLETVELHRANSMVGADVDITQVNTEKVTNKPQTPVDYIAFHSSSFCADVGYLKIEIVMFLYMFSYILRAVSSATMIVDKTCIVHLGYSKEICDNLAKHDDIKSEVEKMANNYNLGHSLIQMVPSTIFACFIGAWSDKYGRKLPIIAALVGIIIDGLGTTICASLFYSRIEYYFIPAIFTGLSGGFISVMTVLYSYAADQTAFDKRTLKYAIMETVFGIAMPLGQLTGGLLFKAYGYTLVFMLSTAGHVLGLVWVMFFIKETRGLDNKDSWKTKFRQLWSLDQVMDSVRATIKKRPNKGKQQILALIVAMSFAILSYASTVGINYLYVHHMYNWTNTQFSTVTAIFSLVGTCSMMISVPIFKTFKLGDATLGLVGSISILLKSIGMGLATTVEVYFLANLAGLLGGLCTLAGRSRISKVASKEDIGKIFAFLTTAESFLPIVSTAIVSQIFNATLDFYPGLIYLILGGLFLVTVGIFVWLALLPIVDYEKIYNNPEAYEDTEKSADLKVQDVEKF